MLGVEEYVSRDASVSLRIVDDLPLNIQLSKNYNGVPNNNYYGFPVKSLPFSIFDQFSTKSNPVNCCWPSPAQSFMVLSSVGTHWRMFFPEFCVLCNGAISLMSGGV
jgi:hypothetical protein